MAGAWALPQPLFQTSLCPPPGVAAITVGRTMFECDSLSTEHVRRLNAMDEVWVPTSWQRDIFAASGVHSHRQNVGLTRITNLIWLGPSVCF